MDALVDPDRHQAHPMHRARRDGPIQLDVQERLQARDEVDPPQYVISAEHDPSSRAVSWCDGRDERKLSPVQMPADPKRRAEHAIVEQPLNPDDEFIHDRIAPPPGSQRST